MTNSAELPPLTRAQVREVDRRAIEELGIPGVVLMENAGRNAADLVESLASNRLVAIVCGRGNNGGDGFVIARHLHNRGLPVELFLACDPASLRGDAATNADIALRMKLSHHPFDSHQSIAACEHLLKGATVVVDAVLGTGFSSDVRTPLDAAIHAINACPGNTVAIDVPSGLDCDTGEPSNATIKADTTITFVSKKIGFDNPAAQAYTGKIHIADIGAPPSLIRSILEQA